MNVSVIGLVLSGLVIGTEFGEVRSLAHLAEHHKPAALFMRNQGNAK
jgi:hypothetical protein